MKRAVVYQLYSCGLSLTFLLVLSDGGLTSHAEKHQWSFTFVMYSLYVFICVSASHGDCWHKEQMVCGNNVPGILKPEPPHRPTARLLYHRLALAAGGHVCSLPLVLVLLLVRNPNNINGEELHSLSSINLFLEGISPSHQDGSFQRGIFQQRLRPQKP